MRLLVILSILVVVVICIQGKSLKGNVQSKVYVSQQAESTSLKLIGLFVETNQSQVSLRLGLCHLNPSLVCPDFSISIRVATNFMRSSGGYVDIIFRICGKFCRKIPPFNTKKCNKLQWNLGKIRRSLTKG